MKAENRQTGEIVYPQYAPNSSGNMRMWVDGKFYTDKQFDRKYRVLTSEEIEVRKGF